LLNVAQSCPRRRKVAQRGAELPKAAQGCPTWRRAAQGGASLPKVAQDRPMRCIIAQSGARSPNTVQFCPRVVSDLFFVISYLNPCKKNSECDDVIELYLPIRKKFKIRKTILIL
jgi:hypothetical protein